MRKISCPNIIMSASERNGCCTYLSTTHVLYVPYIAFLSICLSWSFALKKNRWHLTNCQFCYYKKEHVCMCSLLCNPHLHEIRASCISRVASTSVSECRYEADARCSDWVQVDYKIHCTCTSAFFYVRYRVQSIFSAFCKHAHVRDYCTENLWAHPTPSTYILCRHVHALHSDSVSYTVCRYSASRAKILYTTSWDRATLLIILVSERTRSWTCLFTHSGICIWRL